MRNVAVGWCLVLSAGLAAAQEQLPQERAQKAAQLVAKEAAKLTDLQLKTDVDTEKPFGLTKSDRAALVIPDKNLTADRLAGADKTVVPVGQLWTQGLTPVADDNATPNDKLRIVKVTARDQDREVSLLLLGARKGANGKPELLVYARAKEPLLVLPLEAENNSQEMPIELEGKGEGEGRGKLVLHVLGKYQVTLPVAAQEP